MKIPKGYQKIQTEKSSTSRGTKWGRRAIQSVDKYLKYFKGKILEIGCNDGFAMDYIKEKGFEVEGIDIAKHKLKIAKEHGLKVQFAYQEKMPFGDKSFDTIFSSHTLEHSYNAEQAVKEYQRVAKRAIVIIPIESNRIAFPEVHVSAFRSKEDLINLFKDKGKIILEEARNNIEPEYIVIVDFYET